MAVLLAITTKAPNITAGKGSLCQESQPAIKDHLDGTVNRPPPILAQAFIRTIPMVAIKMRPIPLPAARLAGMIDPSGDDGVFSKSQQGKPPGR
jgi:hypothetical protein